MAYYGCKSTWQTNKQGSKYIIRPSGQQVNQVIALNY